MKVSYLKYISKVDDHRSVALVHSTRDQQTDSSDRLDTSSFVEVTRDSGPEDVLRRHTVTLCNVQRSGQLPDRTVACITAVSSSRLIFEVALPLTVGESDFSTRHSTTEMAWPKGTSMRLVRADVRSLHDGGTSRRFTESDLGDNR